jgi:hypothetical protein
MKHRMVFWMRVIWAQSFHSVNDSGAIESPNVHPTTQGVPQVDSTISLAFPLVVYHDRDEWRRRNQALWDTLTPEMRLMMKVDGYDIIEDL